MAHMVVDASDIESPNGVFRGLSAPLGVGKFKVNRLELQPGGEGSEHDHAANGEEEVYAVVGGSGAARYSSTVKKLRSDRVISCSVRRMRDVRCVPVVTGSSGSGSAQPATMANCDP